MKLQFLLVFLVSLSTISFSTNVGHNPLLPVFGHDFCVDDKNQTGPLDNPLQSSKFHFIRNKLYNSHLQFGGEKTGRVAFLGGSITANGGWRDSICSWLQGRYPDTKFDFINAGIPSMGSTPGAFRFGRDVLRNGRVDLLFIEAAVNDRVNGFGPETQILGMEGIVRHARKAFPAMDIVMMHFVDPGKMADYRSGIVPPEIENHEKVAEHYGISSVHLAKEVTERIDNGEFTWESDFKDLHPSPFGQGVYYRSIRALLEVALTAPAESHLAVGAFQMPERLAPWCYDNGYLIPAASLKPSGRWEVDENWKPGDKKGTRADFTNVPMLIAEKPGKQYTFRFSGNAVGIAVAAGPDAGVVEYRVNRGNWEKLDLYTAWSHQLHLPWFYTLAYGLKNGKHKVQVRVVDEKNEKSEGNACRIRYFYVNGID